MNLQEAKLYIGSRIRAVLLDVDTGKVAVVDASILAVSDNGTANIACNGQSLWMRLEHITKVPYDVKESPGDWPEDYAHEDGCYQCKCFQCGNLFHGHRRRALCKTCYANPGEVE